VHNPPTTKRDLSGLVFALFCIFPAAVLIQCALAGTPPQTEVRYDTRAAHDPDGIGKFYMGREIARVMGHDGADWLERPERDAEEHTEKLVEQLEVHPGDVVADIGAGSGYFTRRLARRVAPGGKVLALDIQPEMLILLTNRMAAAGITNVTPILGTLTNPHLPAASVDLALMVDVYHEFDFPFEMMQGICQSLKPGGRVVFVEYRAEDPTVPIKPLHKMTEVQVKREMAPHPLIWIETLRGLPRQHMIFFRKEDQVQGAPNTNKAAPGRKEKIDESH
jgi:SAM-dependent methyltransferase